MAKTFDEPFSDAPGANNPLQAENGTGWGKLVEALGPASLLVIIHRRMDAALRRVVTPEDLLQDALLLAWRDRKQCHWRGIRSFRSWVLTIIDHRILDLAKQQTAAKRAPHAPVLSLAGFPQGDTSSIPMEVVATTTASRLGIHREQADRMQAALESLPDDLRPVVFMRLFEQRTIPEMATLLDTTEKTVRYRFYKGAELFRARIRSLVSSHWTRRAEFGAESTREFSSEGGERQKP